MSSFWNQAAAVAAEHQARCDTIQADFRAEKKARPSIRRDSPPVPKALPPTDNELMLRLADEVEYAQRQLHAMGDSLSSDGLILARHGLTLQSVDIVGQVLGHIAGVLRSSDIAGAVDRIGMAELKARLLRRSAL
jgi:hypothetical protein